MENKYQSRLICIDLLKSIAIFCVITIHVSAVGLSDLPINSFDWCISLLYNSMCRWCVPIFFMVSGIFFLDNSKDYNLIKYIKRISISLLFWSFLYSFFVTLSRSSQFNIDTLYDFMYLFLIAGTHTWFLWVLLGLYLITPLLRKITSDIRTEQYFLILWFLWSVFFPTLYDISILKQTLGLVLVKLDIHFVLSYSGYFVLGHYLWNFVKVSSIYSYTVILLGFILLFSITWYLSYKTNTLIELLLDYRKIPTFLIAAGLFSLWTNKYKSLKIIGRYACLISKLAKYSLGIYLSHVFLMIFFGKFGIDYSICTAIFSVPLLSFFLYLLSFCVIWIIDRIPFINKWII